MVAMVFLWSMQWHIMYWNLAVSIEDLPEGFVWKPVHGDEFWPPAHMLSISVGTEMQLCMMTLRHLCLPALASCFLILIMNSY